MGVVATLAPPEPPLLGIVSRVLPALVGGNTVVVVAGEPAAVAAIELAECLATSDFPSGSINVLTGSAEELGPWLAGHMDVNAIDLSGVTGDRSELERAAAENVKRVIRSTADVQSPWEIAAFLELKTVWHPIGV
jgi:acyl-CoA reductase-like NAD-dependent aldehyde dehydrogenase